jgi:YHS domain-containing protein
MEERAVKWSSIPELRFAAWGFAFNAFWEAAQSPLYADRGGSVRYLVWSRLHCALGDILILLGCFWIVALFWRGRGWIAAGRLAPRLVFVALGLAYTAASELLHTRLFLSWAYAPEMPRIFGVGLAPILQWLIIPSVLLFMLAPSRALASGLPREGEQGAAAPDRGARAREAVDPVCGATVPVEGSNQFFDGERTIHFCSAECRQSHIARLRAGR